MESRDVFTQQELDAALEQPDVIPVCVGEGEFTATGDRFVRVAESARLVAHDAVSVEAGGSGSVIASGHTHVTARNQVTVEADERAVVVAGNQVFVRARGQTRVVAGAHSRIDAAHEAFVVAMARATVRAGDRCRIRAMFSARVNLNGDARAWAWGLAVVHATQRTAVTAWGSASVFASDSTDVEALETAVVTAGKSTTVRAYGATMVRARGNSQVDAGAGVAVLRHGGGPVVAGVAVTDAVRPTTAAEWCGYYGVPVDDGVAILYKAVDENFESYHGGSYVPGSQPSAPDWDGGAQECGGGLHFSPRPTFALAAPVDDVRFVACPVRIEDIAYQRHAMYRDKVKARCVCAPVYEVHEDGTAVESAPAPA
jgi:hypothetical protein